jgi:hypothetical protein
VTSNRPIVDIQDALRPAAAEIASLQPTARERLLTTTMRDDAGYTAAADEARALVASSPDRIAQVEEFVLFVGWPRSGHSLVGALLDAHPETLIAHEFDVLGALERGANRETILGLAFVIGGRFAELGRRWMGHDYSVPGGSQGDTAVPIVMGAKKGGRTTRRLRERPHLIRQLEETLGMPVVLVCVRRDPIDAISSDLVRSPKRTLPRAIDRFFSLARVIDDVLLGNGNRTHLMRLEQLVANPSRELRALCEFVGLDASTEYLAAASATVNSMPMSRRHNVPWTPELLRRVTSKSELYRCLRV